MDFCNWKMSGEPSFQAGNLSHWPESGILFLNEGFIEIEKTFLWSERLENLRILRRMINFTLIKEK